MLALISIFIVNILALLAAKKIYYDAFTIREFFITVVIMAIALFAGYEIALNIKSYDTQILSGQVTGKTRDVVSCSHSYPCNCRNECSGSGSNKTCSEVCDTCYEHDYDIDWNINTTVGTITIDRVDGSGSQGLEQPQRWTSVKNGEPVSKTSNYQNYIKAVPDSLYHRLSNQPVPNYPETIYDYYHIDRVVDFDLGIPAVDLQSLNDKISMELREVASLKQVNIVVVLTKNNDRQFSDDLKAAWLGGKKNDIVIVIGSDNYPYIKWASVFSWSANDLLNVSLRNDIEDHAKIDTKLVDIVIVGINKNWVRKRMHEYAYLKNEIRPSIFGYIAIFIFTLLSAAGTVTFFVKQNTGA